MISGANEEELDMANARADIMIALNNFYGNYDSINLIDNYIEELQQENKYYEKENKLWKDLAIRQAREIEKKDEIIAEAKEFLKEFHNYENRFKWCEEDYIKTILKLEEILERGKK